MKIQGKKLSEKKILEKYWMKLYLEDHQIGLENTFEYLIIDAPDWVMSIPETEDGKFILVKQYRPGWEMVSIEFPAGRVNEGESMDQTVDRELIEETGYCAKEHRFILKVKQSTSSRQNVGIFRSKGLEYVGQDLDEEEDIEVIKCSIQEIKKFIENGQMVQMASILAYNLLLVNEGF